MDEKISIIVPVYKVEQYINKCIDSILNQTYENIEVLLIDDGSPDNCGQICDWYANQDERVIVHHKINEGLAEARNAGVRLSSGEYIVFVDSDDYIEPDMLEVLYSRMRQDNSDLAICNFLYVDENGKPISEMNVEMPIKDEVLSGEEAFAKLAGEKYWYYVTAVNKLYKKELLNGILFPKGKLHEDEFIAHYVLYRCERVSCVNNPLYKYVQRENSIMGSVFSVRRLDGIEAFCNRALYAKKRNDKVAEMSLITAGEILLEGYRVLGSRKEYTHALKEKRHIYNKVYRKLFLSRIRLKKKIRGFLILLHPYICIKVLEWLEKE